MLESTDTHYLRDTKVAYTMLSFLVNMVVPALLLPVSIQRDLISSFAHTTFPCEIGFYQRTQSTNHSREPSVRHSDELLDDITSAFDAPQR